MGAGQSYAVYYRYPALESQVAQLLLKQVPQWKEATYTPYIVGVSEAAVKTAALRNTAVLFLGVIPPTDVLEHATYYANSVTVVTHRVSLAGETKTVPKVNYIHYADKTSLTVVMEKYLQPYLKQVHEQKDVKSAVTPTPPVPTITITAPTGTVTAPTGTVTAPTGTVMAPTGTTTQTVVTVSETTTASSAGAGAGVVPEKDKLDEKSMVMVMKPKPVLERLGIAYGSPLPWWLVPIDEMARGICRQGFATLSLLKKAVDDNVSEERLIELLSKKQGELTDLLGQAQKIEQDRITKSVSLSELKDWVLPDPVGKITGVTLPLVYTDLDRGTDTLRVAESCFQKFKDAKLFAGRLRSASGSIEFVLCRPADSTIDLNKLAAALGNATNAHGSPSFAIVSRVEDPTVPMTMYLP